jgi:hypothetical protein
MPEEKAFAFHGILGSENTYFFYQYVNNFNNIEILNDETNRRYLIVKTLLANLDPVIQFYGTIF